MTEASRSERQHPLRVLLVDDHPILRRGLRALVEAEPDMCVVGEASDGLAALAVVDSLEPDVVVMDLAMPVLSGVETTERIKAKTPDVKVLALTAYEERGCVQSLLAAGATGYVLKRSAASYLVRALRAVADGGMYLDPAVAEHLVPRNDTRPAGPRLSEREKGVLRLLAEGHGVKEAAAKLGISTRTLETYRARATEKLGIKSRAAIVQYALQQGWLKPG